MSYSRPSCSRYQLPEKQWLQAEQGKYHGTSSLHLPVPFPIAQQLHYTHHQSSLMVSRYTTLVPSLGLHIGRACEAGLSAVMRRERVTLHRRKRKKEKPGIHNKHIVTSYGHFGKYVLLYFQLQCCSNSQNTTKTWQFNKEILKVSGEGQSPACRLEAFCFFSACFAYFHTLLRV